MEVRIQEKTKIIIEEKWNDFTSREKLQEEEEKKKQVPVQCWVLLVLLNWH